MCRRCVIGVDALLTPAGSRALTDAAALEGSDALAAIGRLAVAHGPELARLAWGQTVLRARARDKLGPGADGLLLTGDGLEQATRWQVAQHRARRLQGRDVLDLCCGVGGDLRAVAGVARRAVGVDLDRDAAVCARHNAEGATVAVADARRVRVPPGWAVVVDPARRRGGSRVLDPAASSPPWPVVAGLLDAHDGVAKLAPGFPHELVPPDVEAEWVSWRGELKETALWSRGMADPTVARRATLLGRGGPHTLTGTQASGGGARAGAAAPVGEPGRWLHEPDPAVIRAGLVAEAADLVAGHLLDATTAYVTTDAGTRSPFTRRWEVHESLPFGVKRLRRVLRARGVGTVEVKKRGSAVDVDTMRRALRGPGNARATVVLCRLSGRPWALVCAAAPDQD